MERRLAQRGGGALRRGHARPQHQDVAEPGGAPSARLGHPSSQGPYDRNHDGVFNIEDYCPNWGSPANCEGDSRVADLNANTIVDPEDLIFEFSDGVDQDGNGYVDDFVGWDSYEDDNDPFDEVQYGHGTGEAKDSTGEVDNGTGGAGVCPNCMVMHMRVGDSFIADVNDFAQGVLYATDNSASVVQSALGTLNNSRFAQEAIDYAYPAWRRPDRIRGGRVGRAPQPAVGPGARRNDELHRRARGRTESRLPATWSSEGARTTAPTSPRRCPRTPVPPEAVGRSAGMAGLLHAARRNEVARGALADYGELDGAGGVPGGRALSAEEGRSRTSTRRPRSSRSSPGPAIATSTRSTPTEARLRGGRC